MAFFDWNKDGKKDFVDDYIEYNIYRESTKDDDSSDSDYSYNSSGGGSGCAFWFWFFVIMIILGILTN